MMAHHLIIYTKSVLYAGIIIFFWTRLSTTTRSTNGSPHERPRRAVFNSKTKQRCFWFKTGTCWMGRKASSSVRTTAD